MCPLTKFISDLRGLLQLVKSLARAREPQGGGGPSWKRAEALRWDAAPSRRPRCSREAHCPGGCPEGQEGASATRRALTVCGLGSAGPGRPGRPGRPGGRRGCRVVKPLPTEHGSAVRRARRALPSTRGRAPSPSHGLLGPAEGSRGLEKEPKFQGRRPESAGWKWRSGLRGRRPLQELVARDH